MTDLRVFTRLNHLLLSLIAVTTIAGVVRIPADAQLPVHFDLFGQPDRFAGRDDALILMPAFGLSLLLLFWAIGRFAHPQRLAGGVYVMNAVLPVLLAMFLAFQVVLVFQFDFAIVRVVCWSMAALLIVLGNLMPKSQPQSLWRHPPQDHPGRSGQLGRHPPRHRPRHDGCRRPAGRADADHRPSADPLRRPAGRDHPAAAAGRAL